jgi:hypothetical protein
MSSFFVQDWDPSVNLEPVLLQDDAPLGYLLEKLLEEQAGTCLLGLRLVRFFRLVGQVENEKEEADLD